MTSSYGAYDERRDALVFNPQGECYLIAACIEREAREDLWRNFEDIYEADLAKMEAIHPEHYVFELHGQGIQAKHLLWGDRRCQEGRALVALPKQWFYQPIAKLH